MTVAARKGMLTKAVSSLKETVASHEGSISQLHRRIREKEPDNNTNFIPLGNDQLPVYSDSAALFFALVTKYYDGSSGVIVGSDGVKLAIESLKKECLINGEEPIKYPADIQLALGAATVALDEAETVRASWESYAALVSQWFTLRDQTSPSSHSAQQNVNHNDGTLPATTGPLNQILQMLQGLQSRLDRQEQHIDQMRRTQSLADNSSVAGSDLGDSFVNSTFVIDDRARTQNITHHSQDHIVDVNSHQPITPMATPKVIMQQHSEPIATQHPVHVQSQPRVNNVQDLSYSYRPPPPLKAQPFDGKRTKYEKFKAVFNITIGHNVSIQDVEKLLHLLDLLPHQDKLTVDRYPLSQEGYRLAWQYLDRKYGSSNNVTEELLAQLKSLTVGNTSLQSNKNMWLEAQSIVCQLELKGLLEPRWMIELILHKFSPELRRSIYKKFTEATTTSWEEFRDITDRAITKGETLERRDKLYSYYSSISDRKKQFSSHHSDHDVQPLATKQKTFKCIYCNAVDHFSSECTVIPLEERKAFLRNNGRCENCAGKGHTIERCTSIVTCLKCYGRHHRSLSCSDHLDLVHMTIVQCSKSQSTGCGKPRGKEIRHDKHSDSPILHTLPILYGKLAGLDESIPILLDSGAQLSLIEESLVKKLRLPIHRSSTLHVRGFQSDVTTAKSNVVSIELIGRSNFTLSANVCTMKDMLVPVSVTEPTSDDKKFLRQNGLALPQSFSAKTVQPLIIIGMDILWQILDGLKVTNMPSGKCHFMTKLGSLLTGPTKSIAQTSVVGQYHLLVAQEPVIIPTRESELSKLRDNYRIAVNSVQELRQFSTFAKSLDPDLFAKYKAYKQKKGTTTTFNTPNPSIEKCPPGASLGSGRVCHADTLASGSRLNDEVREIQHGKYHPSTRSRKKMRRQKNLPEKVSQSCTTSQTASDVDIPPRSFTDPDSRYSSQSPDKQSYRNHTDETNQLSRHAKETGVPTSGTSPKMKRRTRDDGDPRR